MVVNKPLCHNPRVSPGGPSVPSCAPWALRALRVASLSCVIGGFVAGCYWLRYHDLVETHCELLEDLSAATSAQLEEAAPRFTPGDVERLRYPLERAREFIAIAEKRYAGRPSLVELTALVRVYADFIDAVERVRVGVADGASILPPLAEIRARAERVRAAVRDERG
jgi:hypothetical protein